MRFFRLFFAVFFFAAAFFLRFAICCPPSHDHHGGVASVRVANRSALHFVYYSTTKKAAFHLRKCVQHTPFEDLGIKLQSLEQRTMLRSEDAKEKHARKAGLA
jgi:hypothetical protein